MKEGWLTTGEYGYRVEIEWGFGRKVVVNCRADSEYEAEQKAQLWDVLFIGSAFSGVPIVNVKITNVVDPA